MTNIAVIYGSSRPSKMGEAVANWFVGEIEPAQGSEIEMIDLAELNLPMINEPMPPITGEYMFDASKQWSKRIQSFDGFVFVVAEYNLGYTPILKNAIDTLFHEWGKKPAALISYGSYPASTAAEQLKTVLKPFEMKVSDKTLHVSPISEAVSDDGALDATKVAGDSPQDIFDSIVS